MAMPADAGWYRQQTNAIGTITPSGNVVVERVTTAILADFPKVSGHFSRIPVFGSSDAYKDDYDWDGMLGAARLLSHANVDVISWNGSKGASLGFDADTVLCERITKETGIAATTSILALDRVLRETGACNIGLVSPHTDGYQAKVTAAFERRGFPCVAEAHAGFSDNFSYCTVPDADIVANRVVVPLGAVGRAQRSELSRNVLGGPVRAVQRRPVDGIHIRLHSCCSSA